MRTLGLVALSTSIAALACSGSNDGSQSVASVQGTGGVLVGGGSSVLPPGGPPVGMGAGGSIVLLDPAVIHDLANGDADVAFAVLARVRLRRPAPATVEQRDGGLNAR